MPKPVNMRAPTKSQIARRKRKPKASPAVDAGVRSGSGAALDRAWEKVAAKNAVVVAAGGVLPPNDPVWQEATAEVIAGKQRRDNAPD